MVQISAEVLSTLRWILLRKCAGRETYVVEIRTVCKFPSGILKGRDQTEDLVSKCVCEK